MRKIDAVLLSALILYDYSAQSLVDSDIMNMGSSYIVEKDNFYTGELSDPLFSSDQLYSLNKDAFEVQEKVASSTAVSKSISYHALAKVKATANTINIQTSEFRDVVHISTPNPFVKTAMVSPEVKNSLATEEALIISTVDVSSSFTPLSDKQNIQVLDQVNAADMQFADTDADGMFNFEDKCPSIAGVARFEGCPVPDSDADGINDEEDRCPSEKGSGENGGCPIVTNEISDIYAVDNSTIEEKEFTTSSSIIKFDANSEVLSNREFNVLLQLVDQMRNRSGSTIEISGADDHSSAKQVSIIASYLQELGVKDGQIHINTTTKKAGTGVMGGEIQIHVYQ
ncbi:MAG TPA: hypothetical protein VFV68_05345 [Agriterribacter sp.]|nr:hypothetical protein [Agriterribacter sp.]